jgi:hypothetical protein
LAPLAAAKNDECIEWEGGVHRDNDAKGDEEAEDEDAATDCEEEEEKEAGDGGEGTEEEEEEEGEDSSARSPLRKEQPVGA